MADIAAEEDVVRTKKRAAQLSLHSDGQLHSIVLGGTPAVLNEWAIASWLHVEPVAKTKKSTCQ